VEHITLLKAAQALEVASDEVALTQFVNHMLTDQDARILMGRRAKATVTSSDTLAQSISQSVLELMV
jgi:3-deoxy-D-manno-octulosonic-acid transferase